MEKSTLIAVDLAKSVFEIAVSNETGKVSERHRLTRKQFPSFFRLRPPATVVMEACGSAHYWGRQIGALGHDVVLLPPHQVRPYVQRKKTDRTDAKGLLEAHRNQDIHPVPVKSVEQQTVVALHRLRSHWLADRTAKINALRGLLREFGATIPVGAHHVVRTARVLIADAESVVPGALREGLSQLCSQIEAIDEQASALERQLESLARESELVQRLRTIPGVGLLTATALFAMVGDIKRFRSARHFASYLGLTPKEHSSGLRRHLGVISKHGDVYLRMLLIHGARSVLCHAHHRDQPHDRLRAWALRLEKTAGHNKAAVGLANKMARIVWALWTHEATFESKPALAA